MSAKLSGDGKAEVELKIPLRDELKGPTEEEIAACRPCRLALVVIFTLVLLAMLVSAIVVIATSERCGKPIQRTEFWKKAALYNIYVPSFQDSNDDGFGDLKGVVSRLKYLEEVGVKVIVLSGLVSDVNFGGFRRKEDENEFENLVKKAKERGISVVVEIDPTCTSTQSQWFKSSAKAKDDPYRKWYHWQAKTNGWQNKAGTSAWQFDNTTSEYYYYYENVTKPVLNYNSSGVKDEFKKVLTAWLTRGAKGFKLKNFQRLIVDSSFRSNPAGKTVYDKDVNAVHGYLNEFHSLVAARGGFLMGALENIEDSEKTTSYFGSERKKELDLVLNSHLREAPKGDPAKFVNRTLSEYLQAVPKFSWPGWIFDGPEYKSRLGQRYIAEQPLVWLHNMLQLTMPGCPVFYYGDEIALQGRIDEAMAWDSSLNGGFSKVKPWYSSVMVKQVRNVADQRKVNESFAIFKSLSVLRSKEASLQSAKVRVWYAESNVIVYHRYADGHKGFVIALNLGNSARSITVQAIGASKGKVLIDTEFSLIGRELKFQKMNLARLQGQVLQVIS